MEKIKFKPILLVIVFVLLMALIPSVGFAGKDVISENIQRIKDLLGIGEHYELIHQYENFDHYGEKTISLNWHGNDERVGVEIDEEGNVKSYWKDKVSYDKGPVIYKFPTITREEGEKIAKDFINKLYPDIMDKIKYTDDNLHFTYRLLGLAGYSYHFIREENGIEFAENNVYISVDTQTGEVSSFYINWDEEVEFPDLEGIISKAEAKEIYRDNIDLELFYKLKDEDNEAYLGYNILNTDKTVDAKSKEMVSTSYRPIFTVYNTALYEGMENIAFEEEDRLVNSNKIISREEVNERLVTTFNLGENYELERHELQGNREKDIYIWEVLVMKYVGNSGSGISARVNAKTGEILDYSDPGFGPEGVGVAEYNKEELLNIAKETIKNISPEKYKEVEYVEYEGGNSVYVNRNISEFLFARKMNGIRVENEGFYILLDNVTGNVLSYHHSWSDIEFISPDNIIGEDKAKEVLLEGRDLNLEYQRKRDGEEEKDIRLVYNFKDKHLIVDAKKAELVDNRWGLIENEVIKGYKDIEESFAKEQIEKMQKHIILFEGEEFKPKEEISQKEFFQLLIQTKDMYSIYEDTTYLYERLISDGILKEEEKDMDGKVTREEAIKYIIRAFGLEPLYDLGDIYKLEFEDAHEISTNLRGHVAKARGLGIISGARYFRPKDNLTREEAAVLIYNILNRDI